MTEPVRCALPGCDGPNRPARPTTRVLCPHHEAQARNDTLGLGMMHARLIASLSIRYVPDVLVSSTPGPSIPLNIGLYSDVEAIEAHLIDYYMILRSLRTGMRTSQMVRTAFALDYVLRNFAHLMINHTYAMEYAHKTHYLHMRARRDLRLDVLVHRLPAPCPACDCFALVRVDGADEVTCEQCRETWTESDYNRLVRVLAWEHR